jgi:hypothetical protein
MISAILTFGQLSNTGAPACESTNVAFEASDCCANPQNAALSDVMKEMLRVSDPLNGVTVTEADFARTTLFQDEADFSPLEVLTYLRDEYVEPNLDHCVEGLQKSKEHCFPKFMMEQDFRYGPRYIRDNETITMTLFQDGNFANTFTMFPDQNGRHRAVYAEAFGLYEDTFTDSNAWFSYEYAIKNRYWARRPNGRLYLKQMDSTQLAAHGDCYTALRPTAYEFLGDAELYGPGYIWAIKFWNSIYCVKDGTLSIPVDYVQHFDGVRWLDHKYKYYAQPATPLPAYHAYKGAVFAQAITNGDLPQDRFNVAPPPAMNDVFAMFCPSACSLCPCSMDVWNNNVAAKQEFHNSMLAISAMYPSFSLRFADGYQAPPPSAPSTAECDICAPIRR